MDGWDEKWCRVFQQEEILEAVMKDEIRTLRQPYGGESSIQAAEEGRSDFEDLDGRFDRRRSIATTLPGYESEGTLPPAYDSEVVSVVDGFRYTPSDSANTPDSSVISTSPRISRDGRDSEFGKESIPDWTLEPTRTVYDV